MRPASFSCVVQYFCGECALADFAAPHDRRHADFAVDSKRLDLVGDVRRWLRGNGWRRFGPGVPALDEVSRDALIMLVAERAYFMCAVFLVERGHERAGVNDENYP